MSQEEIERNFAFIVEQQAGFFADMEAMKESISGLKESISGLKEGHLLGLQRLDRLERLFKLGARAGLRERRGRHELEDKLNVLIDAQIKREESDRQAKQEFEAKMVELDVKLMVLAESHATTEEVMRQTRCETEEVFQQSRRETEEVMQQSRRETEQLFRQSRRETDEMMQQSRRETEEMIQQLRREAEVANLESQRRFDQRMDALAVANADLTVAMAELARTLASTNNRVDALSAK